MLHTETLPNHQGIYAPLSQAMTDSESDEEIEIHNVSKHRKLQQQQQQHQQQHQQQLQSQRSRIPPNTLALKSQHTRIVGGGQLKQSLPLPQKFQLDTHNTNNSSSSYTTNMQNTFRSVMLSDLGPSNGAEFSNFNSEYDVSADNVAILGSNSTEQDKRTPMSPARRCCFIASLLLCLFTIVGFVWLVPCGDSEGGGACPAPVDRIKTHNRLNNYTKIELKGGVNVVSGLRSWENNLIFLYRGDAFFPEFRPNNHKRNGIISLIGSSGAVAWYNEMVDEPVAIDCTLLDVDRNGRPDCLVIDEYGELGAVNPVSGQWHWRYKERAAHKVDAYNFPLILPDLDGDGVLDILLVSSVSLEKRTKTFVQQQQEPGTQAASLLEARNVLRILSGHYGKPIGDGFRVHECTQISRLQLEHASTITYTCLRNNTELQCSKTLAELYSLITNKSIVGQKLLPASKISQHRHYGQRKDIDSQRNIYSLSGRELVVENRGKCPEDCNVTLVLSEVRDGKPAHVLRNFTNTGMYGMVPAQWHFKNSKSKMSGFVMKFWKWHNVRNDATISKQQQNSNNNVQKNYTNSTLKNINAIKDNNSKSYKAQQQQKKQQQQQQRLKRLTHEFPPSSHEFDAFDHLIQKRETYSVPVKNLTKTSAGQTLLLNNYKMQMITETVILVLFIGADTRIENTSQSNIVQFCRNNHNEVVCQPDLNNQENSMLIADLDQDGSQELVSYMSTFVQANEEPDNWKLVTYVRLLRLQSELPAFYDEEKRN
ncbi:uncharacterized protein LOC115633071 [Scaptodrosophila lebanonensis]|uniref:Uncharacterized protein LOC115633071 n=1 Tax=Drosophila lebanonensis TaxID=7225 RepID=A0A6J2UGQ6_DROLE|nr:uncharacterized protein LOC115633071 [Scaptodrosophila lebanonensis]XP_030386302.1 uncharacterized protein LOC115633071 [Scaptodrosophila lebanonensis]